MLNVVSIEMLTSQFYENANGNFDKMSIFMDFLEKLQKYKSFLKYIQLTNNPFTLLNNFISIYKYSQVHMGDILLVFFFFYFVNFSIVLWQCRIIIDVDVEFINIWKCQNERNIKPCLKPSSFECFYYIKLFLVTHIPCVLYIVCME